MDKIKPLSYVVDTDPIPEAVIDASGWFITETMDIPAGSNNAQYLQWYIAQGWVLQPSTDATSLSAPFWRWIGSSQPSSSQAHPTFEAIGFDEWSVTVQTQLSSTTFTGRYFQNSTTTTTYHLSRRKLQSERALKALIADFTAAYNEGRSINDQRYDEIVTIYDVMLDKTETELTAVESDVDAFEVLFEQIVAAIPIDFDTYKAAVDGILDEFGDGARARINLQFDNELTKARQRLTSSGLYNTTVWTSVSAGIEESRARALTELADSITERTLVHKGRVYQAQQAMRAGVMAARDRLITIKQTNVHSAQEIRNRILTAMLSFMERRQDDYPNLQSLADLAAKIGFTDSGAVVKP
jgi:hypothetical protein